MSANRRFYVGNLSVKATREDLSHHFGLDATPYLRSSCWVELAVERSGKALGFGFVHVPDHLANHLMQLNHTRLFEKRITVEPARGKDVPPSMIAPPMPPPPGKTTNYTGGVWTRPRNMRNRRYGGQPISYEQVSIPVDKRLDLVDIAVNLSNRIFSLDLDFVLERAGNAGIQKLILTGNTLKMCHGAVQLARDHPGMIFGGVGIHPHFADKEWNEENQKIMKSLIALPEVIAVGEVGLDFHRNYSKKDKQIECFEQQVEMACEFQKPLLAHERSSHKEFIEVLSNFSGRLPPIVIHCFTGTKAEMDAYVAMGFYIGVTGFICKETAGKNLREAIKECPLDRILLESDAPYMIPNAPPSGLDPISKSLISKCKTGRNEPCTLPVTASTVAKCLGIEVEEVAKATTENANRVFYLAKPEVVVKDEVV